MSIKAGNNELSCSTSDGVVVVISEIHGLRTTSASSSRISITIRTLADDHVLRARNSKSSSHHLLEQRTSSDKYKMCRQTKQNIPVPLLINSSCVVKLTRICLGNYFEVNSTECQRCLKGSNLGGCLVLALPKTSNYSITGNSHCDNYAMFA